MMSQPPLREAKIDFIRDGKTYKTWYKVLGDPARAYQSSKVPLIMLHGGPGFPNPCMSPHEKLFGEMHLNGAPLIFYDQIGCGKSSHPHHEGEGVGDPKTFYTVELFMDELENVLDHFGLREEGRRFDLLGHSWGGMLAADFVSTVGLPFPHVSDFRFSSSFKPRQRHVYLQI